MVRKANIIDIKRGLRQSRLFKNKMITPKNFASGVDLLIPDSAFGDVEANSKIELPGFFHAEGQGFVVNISDLDTASIHIDATAGTATTYGTITGTLDGANKVFYNEDGEYVAGKAEVYLNQQKQVKGNDYTESDPGQGEITMVIAPDATDILIIASPKAGLILKLIYATSASRNPNYKIAGVIDGANKVFTLPGPYKSATLRVYLNGGLQTQGTAEDWTETSPSGATFTMIAAPDSPDVVSASYESETRRYENTDDTLTYTMNGVNTTGTTSSAYKPNSLELSWQGQLLTPGADYIETDPAAGKFDTTIPVPANDVLAAAYDIGINSASQGERTFIDAKTAAYTMSVYDRSINADATAAGITITLPDATDTEGLMFNIKKIDATANAVTIGGTVNGVANPTLTRQYDSATMKSNGAAYFLE